MIRNSLILIILVSCISAANSNYIYRQYGNIGQIAIPVIAGGISIYKKDWEGTYQLVKDAAFTLMTVHSLKYIIDAKRPHGGRHSFPSGHTAGAFIGASYLHRRYGFKAGMPAYIAAALVGHSRIVAKAHWFRDVLGASIISIGMSYLLVEPYKNLKLDITPTDDLAGVALQAKYKFA